MYERNFGDIRGYQAVKAMRVQLREVVLMLVTMNMDRYELVRKLQNFVPFLKRGDKDCGALPLYSKTYTSLKPNREHSLLCIISKLVQEFWDYADEDLDFSKERLAEFTIQLGLVKAISQYGLGIYRVAGKYPGHYLVTKTEIEAAEAVEAEVEQTQQDQLKDDEDVIAQQEETEAKASHDQEFLDRIEAERQQAQDDAGELYPDRHAIGVEPDEAGVENPTEESVSKDSTSEESSSIDAAETEEALAATYHDDEVGDDKCSGDCDTCETHACDPDELANEPADEEHEDNLEGGTVGGTLAIGNDSSRAADAPAPPEETIEPDHTDEEIQDSGPQ